MASVGPGGANTSEGVLANFFNSLLSKKTAQPGSPGNQIKPTTGLDDCEYTQFIFQVAQSDFTKFLLLQQNEKKILFFLQKFREIAQINQL